MALLRGVLCRRMALRFFRLPFRINRLATLDVAAKAEPHRRQHLFCEVVLLARTEAGVKRGGQHICRDRLLDRGLNGPATLAGILDVAGELIQLRILHQSGGAEIEQPRRDDAAAPPDLGDIRHVQNEALVLRQVLRVLVAQDVEAFRVGLHQSVFDAVVHHLDEMPGARWPGVNVAALGAGGGLLAAGGARNIAQAGSERGEDRIEMIDGLLWTANHQAVAALDAPDAAGRAAIDVANALLRQFLGPANVVLVKGIAAIDDDVVRPQQAAEMFDRFFGNLAGGQHNPNGARLISERLHHLGERAGGCGTLLRECFARIGVGVEHHTMVSRLHQAARDVAAHAAKANDADLHFAFILMTRHYSSAASIACDSPSRPASTCLRWTRNARRPRSTSTARSPLACVALTIPKL